jgi:uncharacterized membrane protein YgcG
MNETNGGHVGARDIAVETLMVISALAVVVGAVYFWNYAHGNSLAGDSLIRSAQQRLAGYQPTPAELAASLAAAQAKLAKQSAALAAMKAGFPSSPELNKQIDDAYAAAAAAIRKTDKFFNDPDSADLSLKNAAADPARAAAIESLRREINADLAAWKAASASPAGGAGSTLALSQAALADLAIMQTYLNQLQNYFAALPPSSALQADIIIADQSQLSDIASSVNDAINEVDSVGAPPIAAVNDPNAGTPGNNPAGSGLNASQNSQTADSGGTGAASSSDNGSNGSTGSGGSSSNGGQSNGGGSSGGSNGSNGNTPPPVVTVGDVLAAQAAVDQTGGQVQSIEQQISDSGNPNSGSGSSGSGGSDSNGNSNPLDSNWNTNPGGDSNGNGGVSSDYMQYIPPEDQPSTGPKLIQGDNPFQ